MAGRSGQPDYSGTVLGPRMVPATNERRTIVFNDSEIISGAPPSNRSADDYGKFFPRGMRGTIPKIQLYATGNGVGTVIVMISPQPGVGCMYSKTITPPAAWGWVDAVFEVMWSYDSMFVWVEACNAAVFWGYDAEKPYDGHRQTGLGANVIALDERLYIRVVMAGETAGDVPISGTVTNIPLPHVSTRLVGSDVVLGGSAWVTIAEVCGAGYVDLVNVVVAAVLNSDDTIVQVQADGATVWQSTYKEMYDEGLRPNTPPLALIQYKVDGLCRMMLTKRWEFKRQFRFRGYSDEVAVTSTGSAYVNFVK